MKFFLAELFKKSTRGGGKFAPPTKIGLKEVIDDILAGKAIDQYIACFLKKWILSMVCLR